MNTPAPRKIAAQRARFSEGGWAGGGGGKYCERQPDSTRRPPARRTRAAVEDVATDERSRSEGAATENARLRGEAEQRADRWRQNAADGPAVQALESAIRSAARL